MIAPLSSYICVFSCLIAFFVSSPGGLGHAREKAPVTDEQASALARAAEQACDEGRYDDAIKLYSAAERIRPNHDSVFFGRAVAHEMADNSARAEEDYKKAISVDPKNFRAMENLAGIWERSGRHIPEAVELYKRARGLDPRPEWQESLAVCIAILETRLMPQDSSAVGCWNLGNEKSLTGAVEDAEYYYSRSLELNPEMYQAYFNRGLLRARSGNLNGALADFDHTVRLCPRLRSGLVQRGLIHERMGNKDKALEDFDRAARVDPRDPQAHFHYGRALEQDRYYSHALKAYLQALNLHPKPDLRGLLQERISSVSAAAADDLRKDRKPTPEKNDLW